MASDTSRTAGAVFLLPLPLLAGLRSRGKGTLAGLAVLLTLGIVTLFVSSARFAAMMKLGNDIAICKSWPRLHGRPGAHWAWMGGTDAKRPPPGADVWATTELCVSIMVVAGTALRPVLRTAWRATRASPSKSPPPTSPLAPSRPSGTLSGRTGRKRSSPGDTFLGDDDGGDDENEGNGGDSGSVVGLTPLPPARTRPRDGDSAGSVGASERDRDLELGKPRGPREVRSVPAAVLRPVL